MKLIVNGVCPCRTLEAQAIPYDECCGRWHAGWLHKQYAATPEELMRSRYSAYALARQDNPQGLQLLQYLLDTWHVSTLPDDLELSPTQWVGLQVLHSEQSAQAGVVEFIARYKDGGKAHKMHEISRFILQDASLELPARWQYIDGQMVED
jgi:SEC-C motif domain protein